MKYLITIIILVFSLSGVAQKKKKTQKEPIGVSAVAVEEADNMGVDMDYIPEKQDTLFIHSGRPYVFLVDIHEGQDDVQTIGGSLDEEETELKKNFEEGAFEIQKINSHVFIQFENNQTLDASEMANSYQAFAYWGGALSDKVQVTEGTRKATEFVAANLGVEKESSYVLNTRKYKKEVALLQNKNNISDKSKMVMDKLLVEISNPMSKDKGEDADLFLKKIPKIRTIETFLVVNNTKTPLKSVSFNEQGQPIEVKLYTSKGKDNGVTNHVYENGILIKAANSNGRITTFNYDDDKIIVSRIVGDADETYVYWLENDALVYKEYTLMQNDDYAYMNVFVENKLKNNCEEYYINNQLWSIDCGSKNGQYPYIHTYTSFQDGEVLQFRKSKIVKKESTVFEKYYSKAERQEQKEDYTLWGVYKLNKQNLVDSISFEKNEENRVIKFDYTFYP
jgi:hypothetical protein